MLIQLQNVELRHHDHPILNGVNFKVDDNDFIYIIGKVGSGKSSLLKSIYGELPIISGEAEVLDVNLKKTKRNKIQQLRRQLGIVFQDFQLLRELTVEQNLDFVLKATGWKKKNRAQRIKEVLELVSLGDKSDFFPHELSGGEQQRVCIARALLNKPKVVLADEPTGNLDPETSRQIMRILQSVREQGSAVVMVTHNLNLLNEFPGVVYRCADGHINEEINS
ncbi:MAG: ATP-binding cassette domain-containing protein [Prevotella sp.]|nr:ATP-binding cassette domain-containing protein [Prevotella sp.]MDY5666999.1 ATP-binding cassette domain-containing protein [Alloprevotella sp.]